MIKVEVGELRGNDSSRSREIRGNDKGGSRGSKRKWDVEKESGNDRRESTGSEGI